MQENNKLNVDLRKLKQKQNNLIESFQHEWDDMQKWVN